jgi:condensin complex subunit 1
MEAKSYPMRNATLEVLGILIKELSKSEEEMDTGGEDTDRGPTQKHQLEGFFDLLFERFLDTNSYVRSKVATIFLRILECVLCFHLLSFFGNAAADTDPRLISFSSKFPKQRLRLVKEAIRSLEDKSSSVRKNCIALLTKSILTHPYGLMHGGELSMNEWTERHERLIQELKELEVPIGADEQEQTEAADVDGQEGGEIDDDQEEQAEGGDGEDGKDGKDEEEQGEKEDADPESDHGSDSTTTSLPKKTKVKADKKRKSAPRKSELELAAADDGKGFATLDHDKLLKLRLTKRYYTDALAFIAQIERAIPVITQLIASTVKSEVLEAMDFFKTAHEYKIEAAEVRHLHLPPSSILSLNASPSRSGSSACYTSSGPRITRQLKTAKKSGESEDASSSATRNFTLVPLPTFHLKTRSTGSLGI